MVESKHPVDKARLVQLVSFEDLEISTRDKILANKIAKRALRRSDDIKDLTYEDLYGLYKECAIKVRNPYHSSARGIGELTIKALDNFLIEQGVVDIPCIYFHLPAWTILKGDINWGEPVVERAEISGSFHRNLFEQVYVVGIRRYHEGIDVSIPMLGFSNKYNSSTGKAEDEKQSPVGDIGKYIPVARPLLKMGLEG